MFILVIKSNYREYRPHFQKIFIQNLYYSEMKGERFYVLRRSKRVNFDRPYKIIWRREPKIYLAKFSGSKSLDIRRWRRILFNRKY